MPKNDMQKKIIAINNNTTVTKINFIEKNKQRIRDISVLAAAKLKVGYNNNNNKFGTNSSTSYNNLVISFKEPSS